MSWGLQEQIREEGIVFGLFGNSSADLDLRDTCSRRQFGFISGGDFSKDYFQNIVNFGMKNYSKLIDKPGIQMDMISMMLHNVTACYMYVYMYMELLSFQAVKRPVIEDDSIKSSPDRETEAGSPVVCQEVVGEQYSIVCRENKKTSDSEDSGVSMQQTAAIENEKLKNISPNDLIRRVLKWFNGAGNIPLHICGTLPYIPYTAVLHSRIPKLYDAIVRPIRLSVKDLNKLFILFIHRFKDQKYYGSLLNKTGQCQKELKCCGSGSAAVDDKKKCILKENCKIDQTKNKEENKADRGMFDQDRVGGRVNKASCTKPGECLSLSTGSHNAPSKKQLVCVMLILLVVPTNQNPIRDKGEAISTDSAVFHNFPLLQSWCPNPEKNTECPGKDRTFELKTDSCEYKCRSWEDVKCMDSNSGAVYFCVQKNTTCAKGLGWQIEKVESSVDDPSKSNVVVKESVCPEGFYQTVQSKCLNACTTQHVSLDSIPEGFKMASKGNHTHPTTLMCDYPAGYYNAHNKSIVNFDRSISLHYGFCTHVNVSNPCSGGQMPIHNGTCVNVCGQGFKRDETDFKCREISVHFETTGNHTTSRQPSSTSATRPANTYKTTTDKGHDGDIDNSDGANEKPGNSDPTWPWYFKVGIGVAIVVGLAIIVLVGVFTKMMCCSRNIQEPACTYQAVFNRCSDQSGSNRSSSSCIGGQSSTDDSTGDAKDNPSTSHGYQKVKRSPSSDSLKDDESTNDISLPDVDPASTGTVAERKSLLGSVCSAVPTPNTVVKKKKVYSGNIILKIDNVGVINFGSYGENVQDMIKELCGGLQIPLSDVVKVESTENDLGENGTDTVEEISGKETEQIKETEHTGPEEKRIAGEEFAKPNNNTMTQLVVNGFAEYMKSVGALIYEGEVIGTVFRAGDDYVITAFHVIKRIIDPNQIERFDFSLLEALNVYLNFNATVCQSPPCFEYRVRHTFSSNNGRLDFTVLQITDQVLLPQKMKLDRHNHDRLQVKSLSGIGYGDPVNSFCKVLDPICPIITSVNSRILECEQWLYANENINYYRGAVAANRSNPDIVTKGYEGIDRVQNIFLDISMKHKGSGSPFMTNDGKVIGILTHGHPEFYFHLPAIIQSGFPQDKRFEAVLKLEYVYEHIFSKDQDLAKNLFGEV